MYLVIDEFNEAHVAIGLDDGMMEANEAGVMAIFRTERGVFQEYDGGEAGKGEWLDVPVM